ncbi:MAG: hypothetical protein ACK5XN_21810 [Bacteroidota bacterium]
MKDSYCDYGSSNDSASAYELSMMAHEPDDSEKIKELVALGMHCIVRNVEAYCKFTDAMLGIDSILLGAFPSEASAAKYLAGLLASDPHGDIGVVSPAVPVADAESVDEAPF